MIRQRFEILDGMRGVAAFYILIFHLFEANFPDCADNPLHHAYLGVDFFFMLSGFVVAYAYDHRWPAWNIRDFFRVRLIRLHPLVLLSVAIGALGYWFDPFAAGAQQVSGLRMMFAVAIGLLLLPSPALPNRVDETHSLNGPHWTLLQEYLANLLYGLFGTRLNRTGLIIITALSAIGLLVAGSHVGQLWYGWGAGNMWLAPIRMIFPFFCGLLLYRSGIRFRVPLAFPLLSILLLIVFAAPYAPDLRVNGFLEALTIICIFPLMILVGAGSQIGAVLKPLCSFSGRISYAVYITHYPFIYIYTNWIRNNHPSPLHASAVGAGLLVWFILFAYLAVRFFDEPIRAWLNARSRPQ